MLGAIHPKLSKQRSGCGFGNDAFSSALKLGFKTVDSHLIMKDNLKMRGEIEKLEGLTYIKNIVFLGRIWLLVDEVAKW